MFNTLKKVCVSIGVFLVMVMVALQSSPFAQPIIPKNVFAEIPLSIWWPTNGVVIGGIQPFKGVIDGRALPDYQMFWQVDGGQLNIMADNMTDIPHKEIMVDLSGWKWRGNGPYTLNFVAKDQNNTILAQKSVVIYTGQPASPTALPTQVPSPTPTPTPALISTPLTVSPTTNSTSVFYINPNSSAKIQADSWRQSRSADASQMDKIASQPTAFWLGGWTDNIASYVKNIVVSSQERMAVPIFVAYNVPQRDCGSFSAGGSNSADGYRSWIGSLASGIGGKKAIVILEPDAISNIDCLSATDQQTRFSLLADAVSTLKNKGATVYIDAGHSGWVDPTVMAARLQKAGISQADGFSLNVSNFISTQDNVSYGSTISSQINNKHFVIDTSRNGNGPTSDYQWCNPQGRALGQRPTTTTNNPLIDAFLWIKYPGESDGSCNGGPSAGTWWPEYALGLAQKSN